MQKKLRVGVIFGGRSGEHEVSLMSATSVMQALDPTKYEVVPIGITKQGRWMVAGDVTKALAGGLENAEGLPVSLLPDPTRNGIVPLERGELTSDRSSKLNLDVIFPVLHGTFGEDGTVQGLLELSGLPYVGGGVAASSVGMDKALMKAVFRDAGLPMVDFLVVKVADWEKQPEQVAHQVEARFGYPCFVKPANLGSSVGISKVRRREELDPAIRLAARFDRKLVIEDAAENCREVECSVLGNDHPIASVTGEIVPVHEFYDYEAKYFNDSSELVIPARVSAGAAKTVQEMAVKAFQAIDCAGMARVDFFVHKETEEVLINEINTIPGFTRISMYPKLWEASGIPYREVLDRLIQLALERHQEKSRLETTF